MDIVSVQKYILHWLLVSLLFSGTLKSHPHHIETIVVSNEAPRRSCTSSVSRNVDNRGIGFHFPHALLGFPALVWTCHSIGHSSHPRNGRHLNGIHLQRPKAFTGHHTSLSDTIPVQEPNEIGMVQLDNDDYQTVGN
jgi:hypothetical protein